VLRGLRGVLAAASDPRRTVGSFWRPRDRALDAFQHPFAHLAALDAGDALSS